jgi:phosphatidylserine decarboxylase
MARETQSLIVPDGFRFIAIGAVLTGLSHITLGVGATNFCGLLTAFCIWFFRDPHRNVPKGDKLIVSPADGVVVEIVKFYEDKFIEGPALRVSIFLNVFNVHINRIPVEGEIMGISYNAGSFLAANVPKASLENEQNKLLIKTPWGKKVIVIQIAGLIARRIVCWTREGAKMNCGERFGLIRFGSRVDIIIQAGTALRVKVGSKVVGGETILGELR